MYQGGDSIRNGLESRERGDEYEREERERGREMERRRRERDGEEEEGEAGSEVHRR